MLMWSMKLKVLWIKKRETADLEIGHLLHFTLFMYVSGYQVGEEPASKGGVVSSPPSPPK